MYFGMLWWDMNITYCIFFTSFWLVKPRASHVPTRGAWVMCWGVSVWGLNAALEKLHVNPQELKGLPSLTHELEKIPGRRCSLVNGNKRAEIHDGWKTTFRMNLCLCIFILYFNFAWAVIPKCPQHSLAVTLFQLGGNMIIFSFVTICL